MVKVTTPDLQVGIKHIPLGYAEGNGPDLSPIARGLGDMANSFLRVEAEQKQKKDTMDRYKTLSSFDDFTTQSQLNADEALKNADPADTGVAQRIIDGQIKYEDEFVKNVPPELREEFKYRADTVRNGIVLNAHKGQDSLNTKYYEEDIKQGQNNAAIEVGKDTNSLAAQKAKMDQRIDASGLPESTKYFMKQENARFLETIGYGAEVKKNKLSAAQYTNDLGGAATQAAKQLGTTPLALLTMISFETGGTFNVNQMGGKDGAYMGFIQFSPDNQKRYGIHKGMTVGEQMNAVVQYLQDRGFKPGMSDIQLYATINGGNPNAINARDGHNGGTWGTVTDKVQSQMDGHRAKAAALLGGTFEVPDQIDSDPRFSNVVYEDRVAARSDADKAVNQELAAMNAQRKLENENRFNDLMNGINDGRYADGNKAIEAAREDGWLNDYDQIAKAQELVDKQQKDFAGLAEFAARVGRGDALDPNDENNKKNMGLLFKQDGGEAKLQGMDQGYVQGTLAPMIRATGMVPKDAIDNLRAMTGSNDMRKMIFAYDSLNMLQDQNPRAYAAQVPEDVRKNADVYDVNKYTLTKDQLYETLRPPTSPEEIRARDVRREKAVKELDSPDNTKINFQGVLDHFGADQAEVGIRGQVMEDEWRSNILYYAERGMSLEDANTKSLEQLDARWGNSAFGGTTTLMRDPPEKYYPAIAGDHSWVETQARGEMGVLPNEQIALVSDGRTDADVAMGRPPSYIPMVYRRGEWVPIVRRPLPPSDAAKAIHDVQPQLDEPVVQRIWFRPTPEDNAVQDHQATLDNINNKIKDYERNLPAVRTGHVVPPGPIAEELAKLKQQKLAAEEAVAGAKDKAGQQYNTPIMSDLQKAQATLDTLNHESDFIYGPIEDWPKYDEWVKAQSDVERLSKMLATENDARRKGN